MFQDRNKLYLTKLILQEILLILRFKSPLPERTIRYLMQVIILIIMQWFHNIITIFSYIFVYCSFSALMLVLVICILSTETTCTLIYHHQ